MYSEDFDGEEVEFEEDTPAAPAAAGTVQAEAPPAPLGDAELDAFLAADEPAPASRQSDEPVIDIQDASAAAQRHGQAADEEPSPGEAAAEESADAEPSTAGSGAEPEQQLEAEEQQMAYAAAGYAQQGVSSTAGSSARTSTTSAAAGGSQQSSLHAGTAAADDELGSARHAYSSPAQPHQQQYRPKPRPASARPAPRRSSSSTGLQQQEEQQQYCRSPSSHYSPAHLQQQALEVTPVASWTVNDVCDFIEGLGLGQYRKKFMHHVVAGSLLLRLDDYLLRKELAIGPLGHRVLILDGIKAVVAADLAQAASAALTGTSPEDYYQASSGACRDASSAAAVLVAGLIALKAASSQRAAGGGSGSGRSSPHLRRSGSGSPELWPAKGAAAGSSPAAARRARPFSAPCKGKAGERSPSPVGGRRSPSPGALGPAAGRISVYEQRAKLLFELGRAQARAAATAGTANEVTGIAQIAQREVAALQGQLADLDRKNKLAVQHGSGSVDTRGIIPWKHVGGGTRAADPHPERLARPWDSPEAELTFKPRISARSQQLMAEARGQEGGGGFLDRLKSDLQRREAKQKELEKRYYSSDAADAAKAAKAAVDELDMLAAYFSQRGWASLSIGSSSSGDGRRLKQLTEADFRELDGQLDEVVETYSEELGLGKPDSAQSHAIVAAHGAKKLAAVVAAVRTVQFMDRYHADLSTRGNRLQQLQDSFFKAQAVSPGPGRAPVMPLTTEQKDMVQAGAWFQGLGWQADEEDDCDGQLSALVARARHYKAEAEKIHEKERAAAAAAGGAAPNSAILPEPGINWASAPWSVDGLGSLMQPILDAKKAAAAAAAEAAAGKQAGGRGAPPAAVSGAGSSGLTAKTLEAAAASGVNMLDLSVRLLAGMRWAGLDQLDTAAGKAKKLAVYRALRTQQFLAFTAADLAAREVKQKALLQEFEASKRGKLVSKAELDEFYVRLQADGDRRRAELEKARADKAEREAKALALVSVGPGFSRRPHSAHR